MIVVLQGRNARARSLAWTARWGIPRVPVPDIAGKTQINHIVQLKIT